MKDQLIGLLETFKYPVFLQGSMNSGEKYPPAFFTFWNNSTPDRSHYDNKVIDWVWDFDVNFYATDPTLVNTTLREAAELLRQNGFIIVGKGYDLASDELTHTGRGINVLIIERNEEKTDAE